MELLTPRLLLREFVEGDAVDVNVYESDPEVVRFQSHGARSLAESLAYIQRVIAESREIPRRLFDLAVVRRENWLIGRCGLNVTSLEQQEAMLWYILDRRHWGRGYITEAARALLAFGFDELGLHRVFVDIDARNAPSLRVAEKLGMRREAHFVENLRVKGEWTDSIILGILDREYRSRRDAQCTTGLDHRT
jgi:RimJ/RimL family protein N-acetyltransferase